MLTSEEDEGEEEEPRKPTSQPKNIQSEKYTEQQQLNIENFKLIIKNSFFAPILQDEADFSVVWDAIDKTKLVEMTMNFI